MNTNNGAAEIPRGELESVVRAAAGREAGPDEPVDVVSLSTPIVSGTVGVWTVTGQDWSAVLKLLHRGEGVGHPHWRAGDDPRHWYYWRREAELFQDTELLRAVDRELHIPTPYAVVERPDGTVALWMEQVGGWAPAGWPLDHYHRMARRVGRLQAALSGDALPDRPWLGHRWLAAYQEIRRDLGSVLWDESAWRHPALAGTGAPERADEYRALWEAQSVRLARVEALPRTLCHFDLHPYNLFDHHGRLGAIDWAFAGYGGIGEDAATLVFDTVFDFHVRPDEAAQLFAEVVDGYVLGLAEGGRPDVDCEAVRRAVVTTAAAKYTWIMPAVLRSLGESLPMLNARPIAEAVPWWTAAADHLLDLAATLDPPP